MNLIKDTSSATPKVTLSGSDTVTQLKELSELYNSGVLTKEEFEKAKAKVLN